jgi:hypothetical protein
MSPAAQSLSVVKGALKAIQLAFFLAFTELYITNRREVIFQTSTKAVSDCDKAILQKM